MEVGYVLHFERNVIVAFTVSYDTLSGRSMFFFFLYIDIVPGKSLSGKCGFSEEGSMKRLTISKVFIVLYFKYKKDIIYELSV